MTPINRGILATSIMLLSGLAAGEPNVAAKSMLNIDSLPLVDALNKFADQTGLQVLVNTDEVATAQLTASPVIGAYSVEVALSRLLTNTGLKYEFINERTVRIVSAAVVPRQSSLQHSGEQNSRLVQTEKDGGDLWSRLYLAQANGGSSAANEGSSVDGAGTEKLEEVVVTAQRREERLQDVPISISVLGGEQLDRATYTGINDALRSLPGIDINSGDPYAGGVILSVRGVANGVARAGGPGPVAYYVDGVPFGFIRHALYPAVGNLYDLEQLEFLAGPQGTLYGANALNGVLRILTHNADPSAFGFKARTNVSSTQRGGDNYRGDVSLNVPLIQDKLAVRAIVGYRNDAGWIDGPVGNNLNDAEEKNYRLKVRVQPTETLAIDLSAWHSRGDDGGAPASNDQHRYITLNREPRFQEFDVYSANLKKDFSPFSITSTSSYIGYNSMGRVDASPILALALDTDLKSSVFSQEINFVSNLEGTWRWSAGAFYRDAKDQTDQLLYCGYPGCAAFTPPGSPPLTLNWISQAAATASNNDYTDTSESAAVYGEVSRKFLDNKLEFSFGLRYFRDEQQTRLDKNYGSGASLLVAGTTFDSTSDAVTPRAVLTWMPSTDRMTYVSYSQGFRSGFAQQPNVQASFPNFTPVDPDKLTNYEIGTKGSLMDGRFSYSAAAYYTDWKDIQQNLTVFLPLGTSTTATVNGAAANGPGFELAFESRPFDGLALGLNFSWNDLEYDGDVISGSTVIARDGERLIFNPEYTLGLSSEYSFPIGGSGFTGRLALSGNYKRPQLRYVLLQGQLAALSGDDILIAASSLSIESPEHWAVSLYVNNLTDEQGTTDTAFGTTVVEPRSVPRTIGIQLQYNY